MNREDLARLVSDGLSVRRMALELGVSRYAIKRDLKKWKLRDGFNRCKYDWDAIQRYYDSEHSIAECKEKFGFGNTAINKAVEKGRLKTRTQSDAIKLAYKTGRKVVSFTEEGLRKLSDHARAQGLGGKRNSHKFYHRGILLDSTYELRLAIVLDSQGVRWVRPKPMPWTDDIGKSHRYFPDFYLSDFDVYIDTKNDYLAKAHKSKIDLVCHQNNVRVIVFTLSDIESLESGVSIKGRID